MVNDSNDSLMKELEEQFANDSSNKTSEAIETIEEKEEEQTEASSKESTKEKKEKVVAEEDGGGEEEEGEEEVVVVDKGKKSKELKASGLRYADYTRKTQVLAKERASFKKEQEAFAEKSLLISAERSELDEWRRLDRLITASPERLTAFRALVAGIDPAEKLKDSPEEKEAVLSIPEDLQQELDAWRSEREDELIRRELEEVKNLIGEMSDEERADFLVFAEEKQEQYDKVISLVDLSYMFPSFRKKMAIKEVAALSKDSDKRKTSKSKTKLVGKGKKPSTTKPAGSNNPSDALLDDIRLTLKEG